MTSGVLDASAILAFLQAEPGAEAVARLMPEALVSAVNVAEVVSKLVENGLSDEDASGAVALLPFEVVPFGGEAAHAVGHLHRKTRGRNVSLGDRACLTLAAGRGLPAVTTDRAWSELGLTIQIQSLR